MVAKVLFDIENEFSFKKTLINLKKRFFYIFLSFIIIISVIIIIDFFFLEIDPISGQGRCSTVSIIYNDSFFSVFIFLIYLFIFILAIHISTMTFHEYRNLHYLRQIVISSGHRISIEEVFENDNRRNIIELILNEPGIHFNSLLRKINIATGQLQWHLNVLVNFEIITQKKVDNFLLFFASIVEDPSGQDQLFLIKSKTALNVFTIIEKNPGITLSEIAKDLNKSKSSIKYNIDKLRKKKLVIYQQQGRKQLLFVNTNVK